MIKVGDMVAFPYTKPGCKKPQTVVAMLVKWNGNPKTLGLCVSVAYGKWQESFETYRRIVDVANFFGGWFGLFEVDTPNADGTIVLPAAHAAICRQTIETYLMSKAGLELLAGKKADEVVVRLPEQGYGHLEDYEVPLAPFPGKGSFASPEMDAYLGRGWAYRKWLQGWSEHHERSYDIFLEGVHNREPGCVGIIDPASIAA